MPQNPKIEYLRKLQEEAQLGGGTEHVKAQHAKGKLTARERIEGLLDKSSFRELNIFLSHHSSEVEPNSKKYVSDSVVTGWGTIDGRGVYVFSQDFTVFGGSLGESHAEKVCRILDLAMQNGVPVIGINDSGGARIQEGVVSLEGYGSIFLRNTLASGVVPQISMVMGPCAGGAVYNPSLMDFVIMVKETSHMFITGPDVIKAVTREDVSFEELGGAAVHSAKSGVCHLVAENETNSFDLLRNLLSYLPSNNLEDPPYVETEDPADRTEERLDSIIPEDPKKPYDMKELIQLVVDDAIFFEIQENYARNILVGFARLGGHSVGIVANQPMILAGVIDIKASLKAARFIRFCDAFNIPVVSFEDVPGFLPGVGQEHGGIITHGSKLLYAYCEATVPKLTIITRKAYGGAYIVMNCKSMRGDYNAAWPMAEIAVMGAEGAINVIYRKEIAEAQDPEAKRRELIQTYQEKYSNPYLAASRGYLDEVIEPGNTRAKLIGALKMLQNKKVTNPPKKHGNIPL